MSQQMPGEEYTIGELESRTGMPRRTIHFYVQQGLLPAPLGAGLAARYARQHLVRLRAIVRLKALGWRLDGIRALLQRENDEAIAAIAEGGAIPPADRATPVSEDRGLPGVAPKARAPAMVARYALAPGVDLLVQEDVPRDVRVRVARLLDVAATIFGTSDGAPAAPSTADQRADTTPPFHTGEVEP